MTLHNVAVPAKDGGGLTITGGIRQHDTSGTAAGPNVPENIIVDSTGAEVLGTTADAAVVTNTSGTVIGFLRGLVTLIAAGINVVVTNANANVQSGAPVTIIAQTPTATANGATASRVNAAASTNATSLKATAGQLYTIDVFNAAAYNVFLKLYNKASAPTVGTDTPVMTIPIQAGGGYSKTWPMGLSFATGIAYAITKLQADADTTVLVAGDLTGNTTWI